MSAANLIGRRRKRYTLLMAHDLNIDLPTALTEKLTKNAEKYPAEKAKGSNKKYTEL